MHNIAVSDGVTNRKTRKLRNMLKARNHFKSLDLSVQDAVSKIFCSHSLLCKTFKQSSSREVLLESNYCNYFIKLQPLKESLRQKGDITSMLIHPITSNKVMHSADPHVSIQAVYNIGQLYLHLEFTILIKEMFG
jgi:hypothetical protein